MLLRVSSATVAAAAAAAATASACCCRCFLLLPATVSLLLPATALSLLALDRCPRSPAAPSLARLLPRLVQAPVAGAHCCCRCFLLLPQLLLLVFKAAGTCCAMRGHGPVPLGMAGWLSV